MSGSTYRVTTTGAIGVLLFGILLPGALSITVSCAQSLEWSVRPPLEGDLEWVNTLRPDDLKPLVVENLAQAKSKLDQAAEHLSAPPWSLEAYKFDDNVRSKLEYGLNGARTKIRLDRRVQITPDLQEKMSLVKLDPFHQRMVLAGDQVQWIDLLQWRNSAPRLDDESGQTLTVELDELAKPITCLDSSLFPIKDLFFVNIDGMVGFVSERQITLVDLVNDRVVSSMEFDEPFRELTITPNVFSKVSEDGTQRTGQWRTGYFTWRDIQNNVYFCKTDLTEKEFYQQIDEAALCPLLAFDASSVAYGSKGKAVVAKLENWSVIQETELECPEDFVPKWVSLGNDLYEFVSPDRVAMFNDHSFFLERDLLQKTTSASNWTILDIFPLPNEQVSFLAFLVRMTEGGEEKLRLFSTQLASGTPEGGVDIPAELSGGFQLSAFGDSMVAPLQGHIDVFYVPSLTREPTLEYLRQTVGRMILDGQFDQLEDFASLLRALPDRRFDMTGEEILNELVYAMGTNYEMMSRNNTQSQLWIDRYAKYEQWKKLETELSQAVTLSTWLFSYQVASEATWRGGDPDIAKKDMERLLQGASELANQLVQEPNLSVASYKLLMKVLLLNPAALSESPIILREATVAYPLTLTIHAEQAIALMPHRGGRPGWTAEYMERICDAIGSPYSDTLNAEAILRMANWTSPLFTSTQWDRERFLKSVSAGVKVERWNQRQVELLTTFVDQSRDPDREPEVPGGDYSTRADAVIDELRIYYQQRWPFLSFDSRSMVNRELLESPQRIR